MVLSDAVKPFPSGPATPSTRLTITADDVLSIEGLAGPIRAEHEQVLVQLIAETPDSRVEEKSDYYFRLERARRYVRSRSMRRGP